jgi:hypothetical protein
MIWLTPTNLIWLFAHLFLFVIGIFFLNADHLFGFSKGVTEGIGSGFLATGVAGEILFLYVMVSDATRTRLELITQAGLLKIFPHRSVRMREEYDARLKEAKEIDVLGFGQSSFRQDYSSQFNELSTHAIVRIILIDPDFPSPQCSMADLRDREEGNHNNQIRGDVAEFIRVIRQISGLNKSRFNVRLFRAIPSVSIFRIDNTIFWGPYFLGQQSRNTPTLLVQRGGFLFDRLKDHFDHIWASDKYSASVDI